MAGTGSDYGAPPLNPQTIAKVMRDARACSNVVPLHRVVRDPPPFLVAERDRLDREFDRQFHVEPSRFEMVLVALVVAITAFCVVAF